MDVRDAFERHHGFLDTASYGLPPLSELAALREAMGRWATGEADWYAEWLSATDTARELIARLLGVPSCTVTTGPSTSVLLGLVATALPSGARIVVPEVEFTSNVFPWLALAERDHYKVRFVPLEALADEVDRGADVVSFSLVQSSTGEVADLDAAREAARRVGALVVVDATQALGWLPVDLDGVDALVASAYKWLLAPRGAAILATSERLRERMVPLYANWYAGDPIPASLYGPPLRLATTARRFDPSPAWFSWVGAVPALELLLSIGVDAIWSHDTELASAMRNLLGLREPRRPSAIVTVALEEAPLELPSRVSVRDGRVRISFHLYNDLADVEGLAERLRPLGVRPTDSH
jgi:selenocysteine lyase/cysteine desulfurase